MYFHTENQMTIWGLAEALCQAGNYEKAVRFDVDSEGRLKYKVGEGMWSAPIASDPDPYRDTPRVKGMKWFLNEEGHPYDYPAEYQRMVYPGDFHTPYDTEEEAEEASKNL